MKKVLGYVIENGVVFERSIKVVVDAETGEEHQVGGVNRTGFSALNIHTATDEAKSLFATVNTPSAIRTFTAEQVAAIAESIALQNAERDKQAAALAEVEAKKAALIAAQAQHDAATAAAEAAKNAAAQKQAEAAAQQAALDSQLAQLATAREQLAAELIDAAKVEG